MQLLVLTLFYSLLHDVECELVKLEYLIEYTIKYVLLHLELWKLKIIHFHLYLLFSVPFIYIVHVKVACTFVIMIPNKRTFIHKFIQ